MPKLGLSGDDREADVGVLWWVWVLVSLPFRQPPCAAKWGTHLDYRPWICSEMRCWDVNLSTGPGLGATLWAETGAWHWAWNVMPQSGAEGDGCCLETASGQC